MAHRCHLGVPMAIANHPRLEDGSPFPTLYWLTCPVLVKRVSGLEAAGWMRAVNERLGRDETLRSRLADAIGRYRAARDRLEKIDDAGAPPGGGPDRIKCAHAHVAHDLVSGDNPVGALAAAETGWPDCRAACFAVQGS